MDNRFKSIFAGIISSIGLLAFYFLTMRILAGSWDAAFSQFGKLWYYMIPLSVGFGIQVGLYSHLRRLIRNNAGKNVILTNTTASTIGMIACCAHHITDALSFIGLAALSAVLVTYQIPIIVVGIISNSLGIYYLIQKIKMIGKKN